MADTATSGLTAVTAPSAALELPVNESGTSKKITLDQIASVGRFYAGYQRLTLPGTQRLIAAGTLRTVVSDYGEGAIVRGVPREVPGQSWVVPAGYVHTIEDRLTLSLAARATITGDADLRIHNDIAPRSRITLAGRG